MLIAMGTFHSHCSPHRMTYVKSSMMLVTRRTSFQEPLSVLEFATQVPHHLMPYASPWAHHSITETSQMVLVRHLVPGASLLVHLLPPYASLLVNLHHFIPHTSLLAHQRLRLLVCPLQILGLQTAFLPKRYDFSLGEQI